MGKVVVALDVGGTKIAGGLVVYGEPGFPPSVQSRTSVPTDAREGGEAVLARVCDMARALADEAQACGLAAPAGVGVGAAGVIEPATGRVRFANDIMPGWGDQPLRDALEQATGLPAAALGDVHAHALGEARWGAARGAHSCLCVGVGTGLGGAYVLEGKVVKGFRGAAGHLGHSLHAAAYGLTCACGADSHVESVASGTAIAARYQGKAPTEVLDPAQMGDVVAARAAEGDLAALEVLEFAGRSLGEALGSWCNLFDPELVVLSGSVVEAGPFWRRAVDEGFKAQVMEPLSDIPILNAALGGDSPLVGAAENLLDSMPSGPDSR